ncbi:HNH endonuclease family protein [Streptomyces phytophilus]|uniref:HNH endonuclease family protein n=1 Tax=Streptomyces phytophilus TaxID=722715 RepID=UPI00215D604B|nr:HNH endonuclease family protein [Streptomyces phytophilus]
MRTIRYWAAAAAAALMLLGTVQAAHATTADDTAGHQRPAASAPAPARAEAITLPLREAIDNLGVAPEDRSGYDREREYGAGWIDADRDGCNTRNEVLLDEAVAPPAVSGRCRLTGGQWYSWYDDQTVTATDIDHVVPLAESWDSGAKQWTRDKRIAYANYLDDPRHLEAVSQRSNRQKADKDVAEWLPIESVRCKYTVYWVAIKNTWALTVDPAEQYALNTLADSCPNSPVTYEPVA